MRCGSSTEAPQPISGGEHTPDDLSQRRPEARECKSFHAGNPSASATIIVPSPVAPWASPIWTQACSVRSRGLEHRHKLGLRAIRGAVLLGARPGGRSGIGSGICPEDWRARIAQCSFGSVGRRGRLARLQDLAVLEPLAKAAAERSAQFNPQDRRANELRGRMLCWSKLLPDGRANSRKVPPNGDQLWPDLPVPPTSTETRPRFVKAGRRRVNLTDIWANTTDVFSNCAGFGRNLTEFGPRSATNLPEFGSASRVVPRTSKGGSPRSGPESFRIVRPVFGFRGELVPRAVGRTGSAHPRSARFGRIRSTTLVVRPHNLECYRSPPAQN